MRINDSNEINTIPNVTKFDEQNISKNNTPQDYDYNSNLFNVSKYSDDHFGVIWIGEDYKKVYAEFLTFNESRTQLEYINIDRNNEINTSNSFYKLFTSPSIKKINEK